MPVALGTDLQTNQPVIIGDIERRSGLYVLGKPGTGKSALLVNMMLSDAASWHGIFFIDPHGDAIKDFIDRFHFNAFYFDSQSGYYATRNAICLDPQDPYRSFGINLLSCSDVTNFTARTETYTRAYEIFHSLWKDGWGVWLQMIVQHALYIFIENREYTIAEIPLFLRNPQFREHVLQQVHYATDSVDFWRYDYDEKQAEAALSRIVPFLSHPHIKHIVGQKQTTISFSNIMEQSKTLLIKLSANLPSDIKKFIGTILVSELLHAVRNRHKNRNQFCIFVDEFQHFATEQFADLITEGRKFGIATTVAHQERFGQFGDNQRLLGATQATANKVVFQLTPKDAHELASEFANAPPTETRMERQLVISQEPVWDLFKYGHANPRMQELVNKYLRPIQDELKQYQQEIAQEKALRQQFQDDASYLRSLTNLAGVEEKIGREGIYYHGVTLIREALTDMENAVHGAIKAHALTAQQAQNITWSTNCIDSLYKKIQRIDKFLIKLMEGKISPVAGENEFIEFIHEVIWRNIPRERNTVNIFWLYLEVLLRDPKIPIEIPAAIALTYWPQELEEQFIRERKNHFDKWKKTEEEIRQYDALLQKYIQNELANYRAREKTIKGKRVWFLDRYGKYEESILALPPKVFTQQERILLAQICAQELMQYIHYENNPLIALNEVIEFCTMLQHPDNHIKVASGQYLRREVPTRTVADMTNEMEHELVSLPRFTAYAKLIEEQDGEQKTVKCKIQTRELPEPKEEKIGDFILSNMRYVDTTACTQHRDDIEREIRERQRTWQGREPLTQKRSEESPERPPPRDA